MKERQSERDVQLAHFKGEEWERNRSANEGRAASIIGLWKQNNKGEATGENDYSRVRWNTRHTEDRVPRAPHQSDRNAIIVGGACFVCVCVCVCVFV